MLPALLRPLSRAAAAAPAAASCRLAAGRRGFADSPKGEGKEAAGEMLKETAKEFKDTGSVGGQFEGDGAIGGTVQEMVNKGALPKAFDKDGAIGHQFTSDGAIGGTVERLAEKEEKVGEKIKQEGKRENQ